MEEREINGTVAREFEIKNEFGLHARSASALANLASTFQSHITISKSGLEVNGKSIMGILMLAAPKGSTITVSAVGEDAGEAVSAIGILIETKFGEG